MNHYPRRNGFKRDGDDAITLARVGENNPSKKKISLFYFSAL